MFGEKDRELFERNYRTWIESVASSVAESMKHLERSEIQAILGRYKRYQNDPPSMYAAITGDTRAQVDEMVGRDRLQNILLLSMDAVSFTPSIFAQHPGVLDYAFAMNRRFFFKIYWFPIIAINRTYIERASEHELHFALEHELTQNKMYTEHIDAHGHKYLKVDEKRTISEQAIPPAIERSGITDEERVKEQGLMNEIVASSPLVPKTFAETSLFEYLETHWDSIKDLGVKGGTESEKEFEAMLSQKHGWIEFSHEIYGLYLSKLKQELDLTYREYGYV